MEPHIKCHCFQPDCLTIDTIFALQSLISQKLKDKQRLYCCFIDYQKTVDTVNREKLWYKQVKAGITRKLLWIILSLYTDARACIKCTGQISEEFPVNTGLLQEVLSPLLFNMYINDLKTHFITENCPSVELKELNLFVLMFAEDTVIFANSPDELLQQVDSFHSLGIVFEL